MASNALVSLVGLEDINEHIILANGWKGSEVSDAHVSKLKAQPTYQFSKVTVSTARHLAELFYLIETDRLVSVWVSERLKDYMHKWNRAGRTGLWIPEFEDYYRKGGWLEIVDPPAPTLRWINDAGVVKGQNSHYVVVVLTLTESVSSEVQFQIDSFSRKVFHHMETKSKV